MLQSHTDRLPIWNFRQEKVFDYKTILKSYDCQWDKRINRMYGIGS